MSTQTTYDVIVIGAGLSGLAAAKHLAVAGNKVLIIEARDRIGGRVHTYRSNKDPQRFVDLGASFVHGIHGNPIAAVAEELELPLATARAMRTVVDHNGSPLDSETAQIIGRNVLSTVFGHLRSSAQYSEAPSSSTPLSAPLFADDSPLYADLPDDSSDSHSQFYATATAQIFDGWTGASLDKVSYKWWGWERDTEGPDAYMTTGYDNIVDWISEGVKKNGGELRLSEEVTSIELSGDLDDEDTHVIITTLNTFVKGSDSDVARISTYRGLTTLVTLPLAVLQQDPPRFNPPLPPRRIQSIRNLGVGCLNKVALFYDKVWWSGLGGTDWLLLPDPKDPSRLSGPRGYPPDGNHMPKALGILNLWTASKTPCLVFFTGGDVADGLESHSDDEIQEWAEGLISQYLGPSLGDQPPKPSEVYITRWRSDPFALGTYVYIPNDQTSSQVEAGSGEPRLGHGLGGSPLDLEELSRPLYGRYFFAGEHTSMNHYASAHGAYISGLREGDKIDVALKAMKS